MYWFMKADFVEDIESKFKSVIGKQIPETEKKERDPIIVVDGVASIKISGLLLNKHSPWLDWWGIDYTIYGDIISDTKDAVDKGASTIDYYINSPGGQAIGVYNVMTVISGLSVKTRTIASGLLCSGAYMIASQTDEIFTDDIMTIVGSVGMATWAYLDNRYVDITNTGSEDKRPDPKTEHGIRVIKAEIDDMYEPIKEMLGSGLSISVESVNDTLGNGAVFIARTALKMGMIDGIIGYENESEKSVLEENVDDKTIDSNGGGVVNCNENLELTGEKEMPDTETKVDVAEITAKAKADAEKAARVEAGKQGVKSFMAAMPGLPREIHDKGMDVLTGELLADDFYAAVSEHEKEVAAADKDKSESESDEVIGGNEQTSKPKRDPHVIHDLESLEANISDFRRG